MRWALLEIYKKWEFNLAYRQSNPVWMKQILKEESLEIQTIQNTKTYHDLFFKLWLKQSYYGIARSPKTLKEIERIAQNKNLKNVSLAKTFEAQLRFYDARCLYAETKGDTRNFYKYAKATIHLLESQPQKLRHHLTSYISRLNNLITSCLSMHQLDEVPAYIAKMESLFPTIDFYSEKAKLFYFIFLNKLNYYNYCGLFEENISTIISHEQKLSEYEKYLNVSQKAVLFTDIAMFYFGTRKFKESIHWLNRIRNENLLNVRPDIESFIRLFYIIAHYEAGSVELLPSLIQSVYRFLIKKERLYKFENHVIEFLRKQQSADSKEKLLNTFKYLKTQLMPLTKDSYEQNAFAFFDYISWLESKIENRPFTEIVKEKAKALNP